MLLSRLNENDASLTSSSGDVNGVSFDGLNKIRVSKELQEVVRRWETHRVPNTDKRRLVQWLVALATSWTGGEKEKKSQMRKIRTGIIIQMQKDRPGAFPTQELPIKEIDQLIYNGFIVELLSTTCEEKKKQYVRR